MAPAARPVVPAANPNVSGKLPAERVAEFVRDVLARSAICAWPPAAQALQEGRAPRLSRKGRAMLHLWRREQARPIVDLRAVEIELANHPELFVKVSADAPEQSDGEKGDGEGNMASAGGSMHGEIANMNAGGDSIGATGAKMPDNSVEKGMPEAMSPTAFARWLGLDRRKVREWIVEIPPGPVPPLPPGKIPARRFGHLLRILRCDFRGEPGVTPVPVIQVGGNENGVHQEKASSPAGQGLVYRQIADLRDRYRPKE